MKRIPAGPVVTKGVDVSHWNGVVDYGAQKAAGVDFAFIKASDWSRDDGLFQDKMFAANWQAAKMAGLLRGAYCFFHPSETVTAQVSFFESLLNKYGAGELPPMLDWEVTDSSDGESDLASALIWLNNVSQISKRVPILYSNPAFITNLPVTPIFAELATYPLFIANYGVKAPMVPGPWQSWAFWQTVGQGIDQDLFNGSLDQLKAL